MIRSTPQSAAGAVPFPVFSADPEAPGLDYETSALMRGWLLPLLHRASGWAALVGELGHRDYALAFHHGRLWLTEQATGNQICTLRHLGLGTRDLAARLGRPAVRPVPGEPSRGELRI